MIRWIFKRRKLQNEVIESTNQAIWVLEENVRKGLYSLNQAQQNEVLARLQVIKNNVEVITLLNN
ncbi:hypothetical protein ABSA28_01131 [Candidatus Hepatincolaceae symbiont of Richtersius coronifer]